MFGGLMEIPTLHQTYLTSNPEAFSLHQSEIAHHNVPRAPLDESWNSYTPEYPHTPDTRDGSDDEQS